MSMNKYMHPRNIYKDPPNFKQLAIDYPEFRKYVTYDISGKVSFDFKNTEALRALSCTLLKKDFGLELDLPLNKLIPTIPLRLNYILWIEDLLSISADIEHTVKGVDVGTGASCIYPLLGAGKNKWQMIGFESDPESVVYALKNVKTNHLEHLIKVVQNQPEELQQEIGKLDGDYDFLMCNPPFFASQAELHPFFSARKKNRPHPKNAFCASTGEVVADGGEIDYIAKLIELSRYLTTKIRLYTTMIGHKSSLPRLKSLLRDANVLSFKQTEFCQGNTTRWGLAWTYHDINLKKIPDSLLTLKKHKPKPLVHPLLTDKPFDEIKEKIIKIINDLQLDISVDKQTKNHFSYILAAHANTWSHQRRKRREQKRGSEGNNNDNIKETCDNLAAMAFSNGGAKRLLDEKDEGYYNGKKFKLDEDAENKDYVKFKLEMMKDGDVIGLELHFLDGNKEAMHQILQFIKNTI